MNRTTNTMDTRKAVATKEIRPCVPPARSPVALDHIERHRLAVTSAGQHPDEPARDLSVIVVANFSRRSLSRTRCSARSRSAPASMPASVVVMTSSSTPLVRSSAAKARLPFPAFTLLPHPLLGEVRVINEADLGESVEYSLAHVIGVSPLGQLPLELGAGSRPRSEQTQTQAPRLLLAGRAQKSTGAGRTSSSVTTAPIPSFSLIFFSISAATSVFSSRKVRAFSLPWPSCSPS